MEIMGRVQITYLLYKNNAQQSVSDHFTTLRSKGLNIKNLLYT